MKHAPLLLMLAFAALPLRAAADPVDTYLQRMMAQSHIPGTAVAVVRDGKVELLRGYGDANLEWPAAVTPDTSFQLASATKIFTGIALMRLVEQKKLALDDTLDRFFPDAPAEWRQIRVRQLANHTSGLADRLPEHPDTVADTVAAAMKTPLAYRPGTESRYGFTDFIVLRAVMEKVAGKPLPQIFEEEIARPLGLKATRFNFERQAGRIRSSVPLPGRAIVHAWDKGEQRISGFLYGETGYAAGGLFSSARDLATLFAALDQGKLLSRESLLALETPPKLPDGTPGGFGVGWTSRIYHGVHIVGHSGGPALADIVRAEDRHLTIIVLTNQQRFYPLLAEGVADFYLPPAPAVAPIADAAPELTARIRTVLANAAAGRIDPLHFGEQGKRDIVPFLSDFGQVLLETVGPVTAIDLIEDTGTGAARSRRYAIRFRDKQMFWQVRSDAEGRLDDLHPVSEG